MAWSPDGGDQVALIVTGWSPAERAILEADDAGGLARRFAVVPADALARSPAAATPTSGVFGFDGVALWFRPRHGFVGGLAYAFLPGPLDGDEPDAPLVLTRPAPDRAPSTVVTGIHPTARTIPLNTLRLYADFSAPMSEGFAGTALRLRDALTGTVLEHAFLPMEPELWDPQRTRLTLLLDPGRIKRGLVPHADEGYPLIGGRSVEVVVDHAFQDAAGRPLLTGAERGYRVGPAIRRRLDPSRWVIRGPRIGSTEPVQVRADRPLDRALAQRCLTIVDEAGRAVPGRGALETGDRDWTFTPATAWTAAPHALLVDPRLEDVAGNSVTRVFDRDLDLPEHDPGPGHTVVINLPGRA